MATGGLFGFLMRGGSLRSDRHGCRFKEIVRCSEPEASGQKGISRLEPQKISLHRDGERLTQLCFRQLLFCQGQSIASGFNETGEQAGTSPNTTGVGGQLLQSSMSDLSGLQCAVKQEKRQAGQQSENGSISCCTDLWKLPGFCFFSTVCKGRC